MMYPALQQNSFQEEPYWNTNFPAYQPVFCQKCGLGHFHAGQCKALWRKCHSCGIYGHYAKFCRKAALRNNSGAREIYCVGTRTSSKQKSDKRKQRDNQRYLDFCERKSLCMELPFYSLDTSDIIEIMPDWKTILLLDFESENQMLSADTEVLQCLLEKEQTINEQLEVNIQEKEKENEELQVKLQNKKKQVSDLQEQLETVTSERNDIFKFLHKVGGNFTKLKCEYMALRSEFVSLVSQRYRGKFVHEFRWFECQKCGSTKYHYDSECAGNGTTCASCGKQDHFSVVCKFKQNAAEDRMVDRKVLNVLNNLEDTLIRGKT